MLAGLTLLTACTSNDLTTAPLDGYRPVTAGSTELSVLYARGSADEPGVAEILTQNATEVRVEVRYRHTGDTATLQSISALATVTLDAPLGNRKVLDQDGRELPVKTPDDLPHVTS